MVSWWERMLLSLVSVVVAAFFCFACILLQSIVAIQGVFSHELAIHRNGDLFGTGVFLIFFCSLGWILSVPLVLMVKDIRGGRFWLYFALGSGAGPVLIFAVFAAVFLFVPHSANARWFGPEMWPLVYLAGGVSVVTTAMYLTLLRRGQAKAARAAINR
jgi:hypothetical protein